MPRAKLKLDLPHHLITSAYLTEEKIRELTITDPDMVCLPGVPLTEAQIKRKKEFYDKRLTVMNESRRLRLEKKKAQEAEAQKTQLGQAEKKELVTAIVEESQEKLNSVGKKLHALGYDVVTELVSRLRNIPMKNSEWIKINELLMEFSETRNKAADNVLSGSGISLKVSVNTIYANPNEKPVTEVTVEKLKEDNGTPNS